MIILINLAVEEHDYISKQTLRADHSATYF